MSPDSQSNIICSSVTSPFHDVSPCTVIHQTSWMITKLTLQLQQEMIESSQAVPPKGGQGRSSWPVTELDISDTFFAALFF